MLELEFLDYQIKIKKEKSLEAKKELDLLKEYNIGGCNDFKIAEVISFSYS